MRSIRETKAEWSVSDGVYTVSVRLIFGAGGSVIATRTTSNIDEIEALSIEAHNEAVALVEAISDISYSMQSVSNNYALRDIDEIPSDSAFAKLKEIERRQIEYQKKDD